jgi:hypothetical protein
MSIHRHIALLFAMAALWAVNAAYSSSNPPTGASGAPGEVSCQTSGCHSGGNFTGAASLSGLPDTVVAGQTYAITLTHASNANRAGFQLTALDGSNSRAGDLLAGTGSGLAVASGRQYIRHTSARVLSGGSTNWMFNWTAPSAASGNDVTFYFTSLAANGNGSTSGDNVLIGNKKVVWRPTVSSMEPDVANWVQCYPTLVSDILHVQLEEGRSATLQLFDFKGALVQEHRIAGFERLSLGALPKGQYLVRIESDNAQTIRRIIVQ